MEGRLVALGATEVIGRLEYDENRPLGKPRYAGVVDTVGGGTLAAAIASSMYGGAIATTGLAASGNLPTTVYPFILRGLRLLGIDSTLPWNVLGMGYPEDVASWEKYREERIAVWAALATDVTPAALSLITTKTVPLEALLDTTLSDDILAGKVLGRVVVDCT